MTTVFKWTVCKDADEIEAFFRSRLPAIRMAARVCGYAIGVHGSMRRDMDLIAVPWAERFLPKEILAGAIGVAACGMSQPGDSYVWEQKPMGRIATSFAICWTEEHKPGNGHIDLSIVGLPRNDQSAEETLSQPDPTQEQP